MLKDILDALIRCKDDIILALKHPTISNKALKTASKVWYVPVGKIISKSTSDENVIPRHAIWHYLRDYGYTYNRIGQYFGGRKHTTIIDGVKSFQNRIDTNTVPKYQEFLERL